MSDEKQKEELLLEPEDRKYYHSHARWAEYQKEMNEHPDTALLEFCKCNRPDLIEKYLEEFPSFDMNTNQIGKGEKIHPLPLYVSVVYNALQSANYLIENGARLDAVCNVYNRPFEQLLEQKNMYMENGYVYERCTLPKGGYKHEIFVVGFPYNACKCDDLNYIRKYIENGGRKRTIGDFWVYSMPPGFLFHPLLEDMLRYNAKKVLAYFTTIQEYREEMAEYAEKYRIRRLELLANV